MVDLEIASSMSGLAAVTHVAGLSIPPDWPVVMMKNAMSNEVTSLIAVCFSSLCALLLRCLISNISMLIFPSVPHCVFVVGQNVHCLSICLLFCCPAGK